MGEQELVNPPSQMTENVHKSDDFNLVTRTYIIIYNVYTCTPRNVSKRAYNVHV